MKQYELCNVRQSMENSLSYDGDDDDFLDDVDNSFHKHFWHWRMPKRESKLRSLPANSSKSYSKRCYEFGIFQKKALMNREKKNIQEALENKECSTSTYM